MILLDCRTCTGRGIVRAKYQLPSGKWSRPKPMPCPQCAGRSGQIVTRVAS